MEFAAARDTIRMILDVNPRPTKHMFEQIRHHCQETLARIEEVERVVVKKPPPPQIVHHLPPLRR